MRELNVFRRNKRYNFWLDFGNYRSLVKSKVCWKLEKYLYCWGEFGNNSRKELLFRKVVKIEFKNGTLGKRQTGKTTIRRIAVWETLVPRHHVGPIEEVTETTCTIKVTNNLRGLRMSLNLVPIMLRDARFLDSQCIVFQSIKMLVLANGCWKQRISQLFAEINSIFHADIISI